MGTEPSAVPKRVLFVCVGNSCRSQAAEALARHLASDVISASSAGISPLGRIAELTRKALAERGISMDGQYSKGLDEAEPAAAEIIVNLSGIPGASLFASPRADILDWQVEDPYGDDIEVHRQTCDEIEERVRELANLLRKEAAAGAGPVPAG
jgi:arsenate reductase (thioredoxin)